jgi:quercetin dioxygenase-like cupin family protein
MALEIPGSLSSLFGPNQFINYPLVEISQSFTDDRGQILNIADGELGDVAYITSTKGAVRANHIHINDWHLTYLIKGRMIYQWDETNSSKRKQKIEVVKGQLFFTPPNTAHKMTFLEESSFIAVSGLHRDQASYESDTLRLDSDFFNDVRS